MKTESKDLKIGDWIIDAFTGIVKVDNEPLLHYYSVAYPWVCTEVIDKRICVLLDKSESDREELLNALEKAVFCLRVLGIAYHDMPNEQINEFSALISKLKKKSE